MLHDVGALSPEDKMKLHNFEETGVDIHCVHGAALLETCPLLSECSGIVRWHHKPWRAWEGRIDARDALESQVLQLADYIERWINRQDYILHQTDEFVRRVRSLSGTLIHADIVGMFMAVQSREDFWLDLVSPRLYSNLLHYGPFRTDYVEMDQMFSIATFFRKLIDFKSRFTATHSVGVAECASILGRIFGYAGDEVASLKLAGYFHDIGKLSIPNAILEKPGKLTRNEYAIVKRHSYFTYMVLNSIGGLGHIPEWAAFHHEKLNGSGYPFHVSGQRLDMGSRIMAVADIFTAISEDRPYRAGMKPQEIQRTLEHLVSDNVLDKRIVDILFENLEEVRAHVTELQAVACDEYNALIDES